MQFERIPVNSLANLTILSLNLNLNLGVFGG
jgi:hypothetical protein